jgi:hypothetical protein
MAKAKKATAEPLTKVFTIALLPDFYARRPGWTNDG